MILKWKLQTKLQPKKLPKRHMVKNFVISYKHPDTRKYENNLSALLLTQNKPLDPLPEGEIKLTVIFTRSRLKSASKKKPCPWITRPDLKNLIAALEDSMTGLYFRDDAQITEEHLYKKTAGIGEPPSIEIEMEYEPHLPF